MVLSGCSELLQVAFFFCLAVVLNYHVVIPIGY